MKSKQLLIISCILSLSTVLFGHGDLHDRIITISKAINALPDSAFLYLKRGQLYLEHAKYESSIQDLKKCRKLKYHDLQVNYVLAKAYYSKHQLKKALQEIRILLKPKPNHVKALRLKGKILAAQLKFKDAGIAFENLIYNAEEKIPENYLEAAAAWQLVGNSQGVERAKKILKQGLTELGNLNIIYRELIDLEIELGNYEQAIFLQSNVLNNSNRKEWAFYDRALIHIQFQEYELAHADLENANQCISKLRLGIKNIQSTQKLFESIKQQIEHLPLNG